MTSAGKPSSSLRRGEKRAMRSPSPDVEETGPQLLPPSKRKEKTVVLDEEGLRLKDLEDRDSFAERLRGKDDDKTKKISHETTKEKAAHEEAAKRLEMEKLDREKVITVQYL